MSRPLSRVSPADLHVALPAAIAALLTGLACQPALAFDARAIALGGSTIANGQGVHGAIENPASLGAMQRRGERVHLLLGGAIDGRDHAGLYDLSQEDRNQDLVDDLDNEIEALSGSTLECDILTAEDTETCLTGTARLGALADDGLSLLNDVDGEPVGGYGVVRAGVAFTTPFVPFALHLGGRGSAQGQANVDDNDREYVQALVDVLQDDQLTAGEIRDPEVSQQARYDVQNGTITFTDAADVVESTGDAEGIYRTQFGISLATSLAVGQYAVDVGVTPKFSRLTAYGRNVEFREAFDDDGVSIADQIEDTETEESSFTFDVGAATDLLVLPLRVAAVLRNVVPESIETDSGFAFDTDPQLVVGLHHQRGRMSVTADAALNGAAVDGIETQPVAVGIEFGTALLALRAGLGADLGRDDDEVALSAGFKLGPLEVGGRLSGVESGQFGAQLAFSF